MDLNSFFNGLIKMDNLYRVFSGTDHLYHSGHTHFIVWSTSSDKGLLCVVGGKKNKNKNLHFASSEKKIKKKLESYFYKWKLPNSIRICTISRKKFFGFSVMSEEKIKCKQNVRFFFSSGLILPCRRTSSTKQYSESGLMTKNAWHAGQIWQDCCHVRLKASVDCPPSQRSCIGGY